jgi:hypothetical protein
MFVQEHNKKGDSNTLPPPSVSTEALFVPPGGRSDATKGGDATRQKLLHKNKRRDGELMGYDDALCTLRSDGWSRGGPKKEGVAGNANAKNRAADLCS